MNHSTEVMTVDTNIESFAQDQMISEETLEHAIAKAEHQVELLERVLKIALKRTNERDWVDQGGNPYLAGSGAEKLMPVFGVCLTELSREKTISNDNDGQYYIYEYRGQFSWKGGSILAIGTGSSRSKFFAWNSIDKSWKPLSQVNETNIMKSAYTNLLVNGVTRLLGIRNLTWEIMQNLGFDRSKISKVEYKQSQKDTPEQFNSQKEIGEMLMEICGQDKVKASEKLKEITAFKGKDGSMVPGLDSAKKLSGKRLEIAHSKVKKMYEQFQTEMRTDQ